MWWRQEATKAAKIAVWWDMKDCPIPEGYDAGRIRQSLEAAFKERGYSGPVSITAYGDQTQTPRHILQGISSTGVSLAHSRSESTNYIMYRDIVEWRGQNPPPATMMIISDQVADAFSWDLARLQQRTRYNLFLAYSKEPCVLSVLDISAQWKWQKLLLGSEDNNKIIEIELSAMLCCKSCNFECQNAEKFVKHLSSYKHARQEAVNPTHKEPDRVTEKWGMNYAATPEYATAKILVWWDMFECPVPEGYDARLVRPSLEAAFKKLGYSGPVSITAYGDFNHIPDHLLRGLSSSGVNVAHTILDVTYTRMYTDFLYGEECNNTSPSNIMVIMDSHDLFSTSVADLLQRQKHNLFIAYSYRPWKMLLPLTSAEWLWHSLLEDVSEKRKHILEKCSESESSSMFYCKLCFCDCKSLDDFRTHLSTEEHAQEEYKITAHVQSKTKERNRSHLARYDYDHLEQWREAKSKRMRKSFRMGFRHLDNHLRRIRAPKSRTCRRWSSTT